MKKHPQTLCKFLSVLVILCAFNIRFTCVSLYDHGRIGVPMPSVCKTAEVICYLLLLWINIFPTWTTRKVSTARNKILTDGVALLQIFLTTTVFEAVYCLMVLLIGTPEGAESGLHDPLVWLRHLLPVILVECLLFWNGILRVYLTSVQLGIKWRVIGILCGWIPFVHVYALCRIIRIAGSEALFEDEKYLLDRVRVENRECQTHYPLLLVHGVFFRDFRFPSFKKVNFVV